MPKPADTPALDLSRYAFVSEMVMNGETVTAYRSIDDPNDTILTYGDARHGKQRTHEKVPNLKKTWKEKGGK